MTKKMSVISLFSGIGMQERGIEDSKLFDMDVVATSEIDKFAVLSYAAIHCGLTQEYIDSSEVPDQDTMRVYLDSIGFKNIKQSELKKYYVANKLSKNMGDIKLIQRLPKADMLFFTFPCTDLSIAGQQKGMDGDKSSLVYEVLRILRNTEDKPKFMVMENVANLLSKKFKKYFDEINNELQELGYNVYYKVLTASDFGIPQKRERVFAVYVRKDVDNKKLVLPEGLNYANDMESFLEKEVDKKYYLQSKYLEKFVYKNNNAKIPAKKQGSSMNDKCHFTNDVISALCARDYKGAKKVIIKSKIKEIGYLDVKWYKAINRVYSKEGLCPTLTASQGGYRQPKIYDNYTVRVLTPLEYFRLMGLTDNDFNKVKDIGMSNTQIYKQAGNGVVTTVVKGLMESIYSAFSECFDD